jgi:pimeloyl-ACP methyl ester carboxylesterase
MLEQTGRVGMRAKIRDTEIYFDIEGARLVPEGTAVRERPVAFLSHGGPGADHTGFKPALSPLAAYMQLVYFDHRGHGRSAHGNPATYTLDDNVEVTLPRPTVLPHFAWNAWRKEGWNVFRPNNM